MDTRHDGRTIAVTPDDDESITHLIVRSVAAYSDEPVLDLPPLHDVLDPDALEAIFPADRAGGGIPDRAVRFPYAGVYVTVAADRTVVIEPRL